MVEAATQGYAAIATELINGKADVNHQDENLSTPLHWATYYGHNTIVTALLQGKANVNVRTKVILKRGREGLIRRCRGGIGRGQRSCEGGKGNSGVK